MAEGPIPLELDRSLTRAPARKRVLLALASLGEASVGQLSRHTGVRWTRVRDILEGNPPAYSESLSLRGTGMAEALAERRGRCFRITRRGLRKARSVTASMARRAAARVAAARDNP